MCDQPVAAELLAQKIQGSKIIKPMEQLIRLCFFSFQIGGPTCNHVAAALQKVVC